MSWNYRVVDHGTHLALHEAYYDETGITAEPTWFVGDALEDLTINLERALSVARTRRVLNSG
jgi:hypothetical protein